MFSINFEITEDNIFQGKLIQFKRKHASLLLMASFLLIIGSRLLSGAAEVTIDSADMLDAAAVFALLCLLWFGVVKFIWTPMRYKKLSNDKKLRFVFLIEEDGTVILKYLDSAKEESFQPGRVKVISSTDMYIFYLGFVGAVPLRLAVEKTKFSPQQIAKLKDLFAV